MRRSVVPSGACRRRACRRPQRERDMNVAASSNAPERGVGSARCSDARSLRWTSCSEPPPAARSGQGDDPPEAPHRDATVGTALADERAAIAATARRFRIRVAMTFMALAGGVTVTAAAASAEQRAWHGPVRPRAAFNAANVSSVTSAPTCAHWAPCGRSYHVAPGAYWLCPPPDCRAHDAPFNILVSANTARIGHRAAASRTPFDPLCTKS
jgi:hypothetical protein